jgi:energy-coupling factor transport system ATP-binding protein
MEVSLNHVSFAYQSDSPFATQALQDITFTVGDGELVGILGRTGSGKPAMIQLFNGLLFPTEGTVTVNGIEVKKGIPLKELRKEVGLVFQYPEYQLFEETVEKDVAFGPKNLCLEEEEIRERVKDALRQVNLDPDEVGSRSPFDLSGGQRRRVAIAGVLAMHPHILIMDEPAAGLDPMGRNEMLALLQELHGKGLTVFMVSHSMDDVAKVADRVLVLEHGRLAMDGTPREIYARGEELESMGLGVPAMVRFTRELARKGVDVPGDILTVSEMKDWILAHRKDGDR